MCTAWTLEASKAAPPQRAGRGGEDSLLYGACPLVEMKVLKGGLVGAVGQVETHLIHLGSALKSECTPQVDRGGSRWNTVGLEVGQNALWVGAVGQNAFCGWERWVVSALHFLVRSLSRWVAVGRGGSRWVTVGRGGSDPPYLGREEAREGGGGDQPARRGRGRGGWSCHTSDTAKRSATRGRRPCHWCVTAGHPSPRAAALLAHRPRL